MHVRNSRGGGSLLPNILKLPYFKDRKELKGGKDHSI